jgi:hypothetical protein
MPADDTPLEKLTSLFKVSPLSRTLLDAGTGTRADAVVLGVRTEFRNRVFWLNLRVQPQDEPPFELQEAEFPTTVGTPWVGAIVPVIFDPGDHSRIVIDNTREALADAARKSEATQPPDLPAWRVQQEWTLAHADEMNERLGALSDRALAMSPDAAPAPPAADPAVELEKLVALHARGALTDEQYATARTRILDEI